MKITHVISWCLFCLFSIKCSLPLKMQSLSTSIFQYFRLGLVALSLSVCIIYYAFGMLSSWVVPHVFTNIPCKTENFSSCSLSWALFSVCPGVLFWILWVVLLSSPTFFFPPSGINSLLFYTQEMIVASEDGKSVVSTFGGGN